MKKKLLLPGAAVSSFAAPVWVLAQETGTANTAVTNAMQTVANDMVATGNAVIPIALTVVGISLVVIFGVKMFRKVAHP